MNTRATRQHEWNDSKEKLCKGVHPDDKIVEYALNWEGSFHYVYEYLEISSLFVLTSYFIWFLITLSIWNTNTLSCWSLKVSSVSPFILFFSFFSLFSRNKYVNSLNSVVTRNLASYYLLLLESESRLWILKFFSI